MRDGTLATLDGMPVYQRRSSRILLFFPSSSREPTPRDGHKADCIAPAWIIVALSGVTESILGFASCDAVNSVFHKDHQQDVAER